MPLRADDQSVGREVRTLDPFGHGRQRGLFVGLVVVQAPEHGLGQLAQIVRRHVGGHADRDATRSVGQQVGEPAGQDGGLLHPAVVVRDEIDCLLVDFPQHLHRQGSEACLRVPHRRRWIVARRAEVALSVDKGIAQRPRLRHPDQGVVDRRVTVRVVVAHRLGNGACGFRVAAVGPEAGVVHRVQHAAVHWLEAVANLGEGAADDDAHRVVDVAALHLLLNVDRFDAVGGRAVVARRQGGVSHGLLVEP